jgi:NodT family efflux transporter outer membrane factor (OMF) lipoprotein
MKTSHLSLLTLLALAFAGCTVGPDYHQPAANPPTHWSEPLAGGETAQPDATVAWWKNFHDPELDSLIDRGVQANLDLKVAEARIREARAQRGIVNAEFSPTVDANGSFTRQRVSENGDLPLPASVSQPFNLYQAGFDASWEIDVFGGTRRKLEAADADLAATEYGQRAVLVTLLGEVARSYVETREYQRRLAIAHENIQAQQDGLALSTERYQKGLTSDLDVQQASTLLAQTQSQIPALESSLQASIHHLSILLAQPPGALMAELAQPAPIPAAPPDVPVGLPSDLLQRRPDIQVAERELAAQNARIGVATSDLFPKFYLTGTAGLQSIGASDWFTAGSKFWSFGPTMQWRIFDANQIQFNIKVQDAREQEALAQYEKTVLVAFENVEDSLVSYANEQVRRQSLEQAVSSSQESLDLANERYKNGLASFLDVVEAERSLYLSQDQLVQSNGDVSVNLISLYKSLGGGWQMEAPPIPAVAVANIQK